MFIMSITCIVIVCTNYAKHYSSTSLQRGNETLTSTILSYRINYEMSLCMNDLSLNDFEINEHHVTSFRNNSCEKVTSDHNNCSQNTANKNSHYSLFIKTTKETYTNSYENS